MTVCVIDASAAIAWAIEAENSPRIDELFERVGDEGAAVPSIWHHETLNALVVAERRRRIDSDRLQRYGGHFQLLPLMVDYDAPRLFWRETLAHARSHGLSFYDASYLELAIRIDLPLATLDKALAAAATREGVELLLA